MPILKSEKDEPKKKVSCLLRISLLNEIEEYCKFANLKKIDTFIEEAAKFVFSKDSEWKRHKKEKKRAAKQSGSNI